MDEQVAKIIQSYADENTVSFAGAAILIVKGIEEVMNEGLSQPGGDAGWVSRTGLFSTPKTLTFEKMIARSSALSNEEGEYSVFQINRAAEAAIIYAMESLSDSNDGIFKSDEAEYVQIVLRQALKMLSAAS